MRKVEIKNCSDGRAHHHCLSNDVLLAVAISPFPSQFDAILGALVLPWPD